jgi:hypothetical protein
MPNFTAGTSFTDGVTNDVTALKLNALVADAVPTSSLALTSTNGTIANFTSSTANITLGTIPTLTAGTTTGTAGIFTSGTITTGLIPTLTTGTTTSTNEVVTNGTITNLSATTSTFLGTITGSTNVINIGSGQIYKDASGNVGIGTASPAAKLDVVGEVNLPNGNALKWGNSGNYITGSSASNAVLLATNSVERLRIDSSGNVGIGTASPTNLLHIKKANALVNLDNADGNNSVWQQTSTDTRFGSQSSIPVAFYTNSLERFRIDSSGNVGIGQSSLTSTLTVNKAGTDTVIQMQEGGTNTAQIESFQSSLYLNVAGANNIIFRPNSTERMRIDSDGNVLVGKATTAFSTAGVLLSATGCEFVRDSQTLQSLNRLTNDGTLVNLCQDGNVEGTISVSGTTVSYNGGHLSRFSQLPSGQRDPAIKKGTVLSNLDAMCEWRDADGSLLPNEQLNKVKISDVEGDSNTAGVFVNWDNDDQDNPYDLNMAMTGDMIIRIAQGTSVNRGDLLMSAGDGTAKPQGDDIIRSKTIAKVTSTNVTCTYEDGSYCVPCVLMAC